MAVAILISTFGCVNGLVLAGARVYLRDGPRRPVLPARRRRPTPTTSRPSPWSPRGSGPSLLILPVTVDGRPGDAGRSTYGNLYNQLLEYLIPVDLTFYMLMVGSVVDAPAQGARGRPALPDDRLPGPAADLHRLAVLLVVDFIYLEPRTSGIGYLIVLAGIPVYWLRSLTAASATRGRTARRRRLSPSSRRGPGKPTAMIVSWNWLTDYLRLDMPVEVLTERLALAGLNHESTAEVGGDLAIDLEVTSNRPDCLGHLGVAREIGVLFDRPVRVPDPRPADRRAPPVETLAGGPDRGARPLPAVHRAGRHRRQGRREPLVDAEAAGDAGRPADQQRRRRDQLRHVRVRPAAPRLRPRPTGRGAGLVVRRARTGETLKAINGKDYELTPEMLVIADAARPGRPGRA